MHFCPHEAIALAATFASLPLLAQWVRTRWAALRPSLQPEPLDDAGESLCPPPLEDR